MLYRELFSHVSYAGDSIEYRDVNDLEKLKGLQFIHVNARSILHKISSFRYDFLKSCMGIIGVSETWLNNLVPDSQVSLPNYSLIRNDRREGRGGGGHLLIH